jgi:hypothetical protein
MLLLLLLHTGGVVKADEFDSFHEMIIIDEVARCGSGGVVWGLFEGLSLVRAVRRCVMRMRALSVIAHARARRACRPCCTSAPSS